MHLAAAKLALLIAAACSCSSAALPPPATAITHAGSRCLPHERDALLAFKEGITGDDEGFLASWRRRGREEEDLDCCRWRGVACSNRTGRVVKLDLRGSGLEGQISSRLVSLDELEYLDLSHSGLLGMNGSVPEFLGSLKNLRHLDLSWIPFSGTLPPHLGNLSTLEYLDLSNKYSLTLPPQLGNLSNLRHLSISSMKDTQAIDISWLARLHLLEYLDVSHMNLSMAVDWPSVLNSMPSLEVLHLSYCSLPSTRRSMTQLNLTNLVELHVSGNNFGNLEFLGSMKNLRYLDLSHASILSGRVPPQLGNLTHLQHLDLGFMPNMYSTDISWLTNLHHLEYLDMSNVDLSTITDLPLVVNMIPSLKELSLKNCSLSSANQTLTRMNLTKLESLDLSRNYFGHPIASSWFWKVRSIVYLELSETYLNGPFPDALGGMTSLQWLYFTKNGNAATMTVDLKNLCELVDLYLDESLSSGNITEFVEKLPRCSSSRLRRLSLRGNNMAGMLPNAMGHINSLNNLVLSNNSISGDIPLGLQNLTRLVLLFLDSNRLTGQIPMLMRSLLKLDISMNSLSGNLPSKFGAPHLRLLILSHNHITGQIPESICMLQDMGLMDLSNNSLEGELPPCFSMPNLIFLLLSNNRFSGEFPLCLRSSSSLAFLDLSWNKFYGKLPSWIGNLQKLRFLQLRHNIFYGDIPISITNLSRLQHLNLADNNLSGSIPWYLRNLTAMTLKHPTRINIAWYEAIREDNLPQNILSQVMKHQELKYAAAGSFDMVCIDLSLNQLTGGIPEEITSLNGLVNLNLSLNHLSGKIPENIGAMKSLESLDFSRNNLSGEIPTSLADLTFLSSMDLSYNNLVGRIPHGHQLDTLYPNRPSMYDGNSGLCGPPLQRICPGNNAQEHGNQNRSKNDPGPKVFFYFGFVSGFVIGLWVVFCIMLFKRSWRVAYFHQFDKLYDKAYVFAFVTWGQVG